jgi:alkylresorcinol/alkylpyrone synthase
MPAIAAISKIDFPHKIDQQLVKFHAREMFIKDFPAVERLINAFDNTEIRERNFCQPSEYYLSDKTFEEHNNQYIATSLEYSVKATEECLEKAGLKKEDITDIIFVSTTGLATPSLDALIINQMHLNSHINRIPVWGLGCAGGVSGMAKAFTLAKANPKAVVLFIAVELCSLTLLRNDFSKSNFIASSLFSDGIAACLITGTEFKPGGREKSPATATVAGISAASLPYAQNPARISYLDSISNFYYDTLDIMGWDFLNSGFKVLFSKDIPTLIHQNIKRDIENFLSKRNLNLGDIRNFIFHPGGKKVLEAYAEALSVEGDFLKNTREVMNDYGNMSSSTVLYVLEKFMHEGFEDGYGLMLAMGPGFSSEMVLLEMHA